jgi:mono/diheme cytochrome c family protein
MRPFFARQRVDLKLMKSMKTLMMLVLVAGAGVALAAAKVDVSKLPPVSTKVGVTYEKDIKPIFDKSCLDCHGPVKPKAKLRLDSLEEALKGAGGDDVLSKGKSAESLLVHSIAQLDPDYAMPPEGKGDPLTKEQVGLVRAWIDQGLK